LRAKSYVKRLERDLPDWAGKGWLAPGGADAILADARAKSGVRNIAPLAFGILGAVTLGAGIITFFAANWQEIPKLAKLAMLLATLWISFAASGYALRREGSALFGQALLLLTVLLFGANIQLVGQAFHIGRHYPDGILLWSLGALLLTAVVASEPVAVTGLMLAGLWTSTETFGFSSSIHWPFLVVWLGFMIFAMMRGWTVARHVGFLAALYWCAISIVGRNFQFSIYLVALYVPVAMALAMLGAILAERTFKRAFGASLRTYALILGLGAVYGLSFRSLEGAAYVVGPGWRWIAALGITAVLLIALVAWRGFKSARKRDWADLMGWALIALALAGTAAIFFDWIGPAWLALSFKILLFSATLWLIARGYRSQTRSVVNIGFGFFALGLLTVYFDTVWTLTSRSFALMGGGILLLGGGYLLEHQRRKLFARWDDSPESAP
jgi:uncharacterized membrane protein